MENNLIWNAGCLRISIAAVRPESGTPATRSASAGKEICEPRRRAACLIDAHIIDVAVEAGKIDVFENAVRPFFLLQAFIRKTPSRVTVTISPVRYHG